MAQGRRDEFTSATKKILAERVGYCCSNPNCRRKTVGPNSNPKKSASIGEAAHIRAAAPKGPRYDPSMTAEERASVENGIWLCKNCARLIDVDSNEYSVDILEQWKYQAEQNAKVEISTRDGESVRDRNATVWDKVSPQRSKPEMESDVSNELGTEESELRTYLAGVLERKRDSHPSFKLMKVDEIDSRLFPKVEEYSEIPPRGRIKDDTSDSKSDNCLVWDIIRSSWKEDEHRSVVIIGEGGIGKTVTLFSITRSAEGTESVPALYIPMYELVDKDGNLLDLTAYFMAKYKKYGEQIETLATTPWKERPQILILLDGFNEVPNLLRRSALSEINDWHDTHPGAQLIAVSRPMDGLNLSKELAGNPIPITLALLDTSTVSAYLKEAGRRIPSPNAPIWEDLRYPLFLNLYIKTGRLKGETPAGYPLHVVEADSGGALIWNYLQRELLRQKTDKDGKAAAWVIRCAVANEYILPFIAYHMVSTQRMDISFDEAEKMTKEALDLLDRGILPKHLKQIWGKHKRGPKGTYPERGMFTEQIWRDTVLRDSGVLVSSARKHGEIDDIPEDAYYSFMHQNFRDCLAGLYLVNQAETCSEKKYPEVWQHGQSHLALKYAAELMDEDTANKLWETNRELQQYAKPGYVRNHTATCTLLELQKQRKPLPDALDFSGMDLSDLSLTRYLGKGKTDLKLFGEARLTRNTKLDRTTFQNEGHTNWVNCVAELRDGRVVSGSDDRTLRVWDAAAGQCLQTLEGHSAPINCVAELRDGRVVSGSSELFGKDYTLRVWDAATGQCLQTLEGHTSNNTCVAELRDGRVVSGSWDSTLRVWDPNTGKQLDTFESTEVNVSQMDFSEAILTEDPAVLLWRNGATIPDADIKRWVKPRFWPGTETR